MSKKDHAGWATMKRPIDLFDAMSNEPFRKEWFAGNRILNFQTQKLVNGE